MQESSEEPPGNSLHRRPSLKALARELGVSHTTVSNAFRQPGQLSPALRERILSAARERGIAGPDPTALGLRLGRTGQIGVVFTDHLSFAFADPAAVQVLQGIASVAEGQGASLVLVPGTPVTDQRARTLARAAVDGLILYSVAADDQLVAAVVGRGVPTVVIDQPGIAAMPLVGIDDRSAARLLTDHLCQLGHRRLGLLALRFAPDSPGGLASERRQRTVSYPLTEARLAGCRDAWAAHGLDWGDVTVFECRASTRAEGRAGAEALLAAAHTPTAVLAFSDLLAFGALDAARAEGLDVPTQLAVAGFDDIPDAEAAGLTTTGQPHREKGRVAGERLFALMGGADVPMRTILPAELIPRSSTLGHPGR